jgi:WD40 repeat protein
VAAVLLSTASLFGAPIPIAPLDRATPVDFEKEVVPFLRDNCFACHCQTTKKGGLNLETPELMLKGGDSGPAIIAGKGAESLALQAAAHFEDDLRMPPRDNKAKARDLTGEQLALLKLWIDQGAKPSQKAARVLAWQAVPDSVQAIYAAAITPDAQFAACARANRISIYHLPSARAVGTDAAHRDQVNALAFSPDGTLLASAGYREVKLWRRARDVQRLVLADAGTRVALSADGKWLATAGDDGRVKLWEWPAGKMAREFSVGSSAVRALAFSTDGARLVCVSADKALAIWRESQQVARVEMPAEGSAVIWFGDKLVTGGADNVIRVWSEALAPVKELPGHTGAVTALAAREGVILSGSADGTARAWDVAKGQATVQMNHGGPVNAVAIRADGKVFSSAGANNVAKLWDLAGKQLAEMSGNRLLHEAAESRDRALQIATGNVGYRKEVAQKAEKTLAAANDGMKKATDALAAKQQDFDAKQKALTEATEAKSAADAALAALDAEIKKATEALEAANQLAQQAKSDAEALKASTQQDHAALEMANADAVAKAQEAAKAKGALDQQSAQRKPTTDKTAAAAKKLTDTENAAKASQQTRAAAELDVNLSKSHIEESTVAWNDAKAAIEAAEGARVKADADLQAARKAVGEAAKPLRAIAFSADNLTVATCGEDGLIHTWSANSGAAFDVLARGGGNAAATALVFSPGGELISAAEDRLVIAWDANPPWKLERTIGTGDANSPFVDRVCALAFSADGKLLATGGGDPSRAGEIKIWDVATGEMRREFSGIHSDVVFGAEFSPDGNFLATAGADRLARLIDLESGKVARTFEGHTAHVLSLSWSPEGRTLATAGADAQVKLWDAASGDRKKNIEGYEKEVTAVRFAGVGATLVTASGDNKVRLLAPDGNQVRLFPGVADFMQSAAVSADGKTIVAGGQDSVLRVWNAADGKSVGAFK